MTQVNNPAVLPSVGDWFRLPSGRVVSVRSIEGADHEAECAVRYVDVHGAMALGEFHLTLAYISRGQKIGHD